MSEERIRSSGQPADAAPAWLDPALYPFASHWFTSVDGRMHFVDEGTGPPVVLVHGTPTWSFLFRHLVIHLRERHRVIAIDHLGFGLSDKPKDAPYEPRDHARRLLALLDALDLRDATLAVHDFGGPIGLAAAIARPHRFERLVLFNTWMWSVGGDAAIARGARVAGSWLGRLLYRYGNFPVKVLMPKALGDRSILTPAVHRHYAAPLGRPDERMGAWGCARALLGSGPWFDELWSRRDRLGNRPMMLLWGMRDPTFGAAYLERWRHAFPDAAAHTFPSSGHFVPEEVPDAVAPILGDFIFTAARPDRRLHADHPSAPGMQR